MTGWSVLFWLIVTFLLLHPLNRWISSHVQGVAFLLTGSQSVAMWLFWVLFLPGTLLHEFSHWLVAVLLRVKTSKFSLWPKVKRGGQLQLGSVQVDVADPFRHSLIGLAPLIFGSLAVLIIGQGRLDLGRLGLALSSGLGLAAAAGLAATVALGWLLARRLRRGEGSLQARLTRRWEGQPPWLDRAARGGWVAAHLALVGGLLFLAVNLVSLVAPVRERSRRLASIVVTTRSPLATRTRRAAASPSASPPASPSAEPSHTRTVSAD